MENHPDAHIIEVRAVFRGWSSHTRAAYWPGPRNGTSKCIFSSCRVLKSKNSGCKRSKKMSYFLHGMHLSPLRRCIPQMLLWWEELPHLCVDCPTPTPGLLAQQPGATDTLREAPCLPQCSVPNTSWCCRGGQQEFEFLYVDVIIHV